MIWVYALLLALLVVLVPTVRLMWRHDHGLVPTRPQHRMNRSTRRAARIQLRGTR